MDGNGCVTEGTPTSQRLAHIKLLLFDLFNNRVDVRFFGLGHCAIRRAIIALFKKT